MNVYIGGPVEYSDMQGPAPSGFHVPLYSEWQAIVNTGISLGAWSSSNGVNLATYLKLPMAGFRDYDKSVYDVGSYGGYWSSSSFTTNLVQAQALDFSASSIFPRSNGYRSYGFSIRCLRNSPVIPTASWTTLYQGSGSAGIFHNSTDGLISISSDGTTWYTLMDKNLGATIVYNYGDTPTDANCGNVFQWGNNYAFPGPLSSDSITSSSTQVDVTGYGPGNYYESSTWITTDTRQSSASDGYNLRGGISKQSGTKSVEVQNIYIGEVRPKTFTITWQETSDPSQFFVSYSDDAAGLTQGSTAFDDFFGYYGCRLSNAGVETAKESQSAGVLDITQLGTLTSGDNVMIAFPRRGIRMSKSGSIVTLSITDEPNKTGFQYYAHTKGSDAKNNLYLGAYKMSSGYKSLSGKAPLVNLTRDGFRSGVKSTYDSSAGTNRYSQITIYPRWFINALYMMKYGNPNSQSVIGQGYTGGSAVVNTGGTNSQTSASYGTSSATTQAKLFGLEDWWGNVNEWMDGCYFNSSTQLTVDKTNSVFQDSDYSTNLSTSSSGYMSAIGGTNDKMFQNVSSSAGTDSTYYADYSQADASRVLLAGGSRYYGAFVVITYSASSASASIGSRLMYL